MIHQLRIYEGAGDKKAAFHSRFRDHALRIMKRYKFDVVALWESTSVMNFEFIYVLRWPDEETLERQWNAFLADPEWIDIKRRMANDIGEPVRRVTSRVLRLADYSPPFDPASKGFTCNLPC